ncbi:Phosphate acyltransferase PlsX [Planctomycetales bacterium 10988]|nr:Phosphate acyltransferase PlsX [Planctomycetales bacterium 10988]
MRIALDAMGGDYAPEPNVLGARQALQEHEGIEVVLVGDEEKIAPLLEEDRDHPRLSILHCSQVVGMHERPSAVRSKRDSSIARCWELMATNKVDALVSAGNTGAVAAAGLFTRLFLKGVRRPGIAVVIPTKSGPSILLDVGANAACKPEHLYQYGVMGSLYAQKIVGIEQPTIGLMNIGTEDGKGNELVKETHRLFNQSHFSDAFHGNIEGRDLYQGTANVVVCDGFVGNVVLKVSEGMFEYVMGMAAEGVLPALNQERDLAKQAFKKIADRYHHSSFGGAPLLGIEGTCLICHGSSNDKSIRNALLRTAQHAEVHLNEVIVAALNPPAEA